MLFFLAYTSSVKDYLKDRVQGCGYDEITPFFIKLSCAMLTPKLTILVNSGLSLGNFPNDLQTS